MTDWHIPTRTETGETLTPDIMIRARIFAGARPSAAVLCAGPETQFREGWFPRLARQFIRNADDPPLGYSTREAAVDAARRYRASCEELINREH